MRGVGEDVELIKENYEKEEYIKIRRIKGEGYYKKEEGRKEGDVGERIMKENQIGV